VGVNSGEGSSGVGHGLMSVSNWGSSGNSRGNSGSSYGSSGSVAIGVGVTIASSQGVSNNGCLGRDGGHEGKDGNKGSHS